MPIGGNKNQSQQTGTQQNGDILAQLEANQATTKDVYTLEKNMNSTLSKIEKNQNKANTVLSDIQKLAQKGTKAISSVNTELQNLLRKIDSIVSDAHKISTNTAPVAGTGMGATGTDLSGVLDKLDSIEKTISSLTPTATPTSNAPVDLSEILDRLDTLINNNTDTIDLSEIIDRLDTIINDTTDTVDLSDVVNHLNTIATNTDNASNFSDIIDRLDTISNNQTNSVGNANNDSDVADIKSMLERLVELAEQQAVDVMDATSYVNDCSSYLDEIRELLRNIDDRGDSMNGFGNPPDDATRVDSFDDINNTLLDILDVLTDPDWQIMHGATPRRRPKTADEEKEEAQAEIDQLLDEMRGHREVDDEGNPKHRDFDANSKTAMSNMLENILGDSFLDIANDTIGTVAGAANKWGTGQYITGDVINGVGSVIGDVAGTAISTAINAVVPGLGDIIGNALDKTITKAFNSLADYLSYIVNKANNNRDTLLKDALDKIRKDVTAMTTYGIEVQEASLNKIYEAWDQNLSSVSATQGYTKEALNSLQDAVAQRLQKEGYSTAINAADYMTQLGNTLNAKLGGDLAEAFAAQNLILQKVVPELDLSSMAADFAAIYTNAEKQGMSGETAMIDAMNQVAGAVKALEETTGGNNQFINQVGSFLKKAEEVVNRSTTGTPDQIASLTTQLMAAEAPLASLVPQLSGFTTTMVDTLTKGNDATATALRAIMHDINENVGVNATEFLESFVSDTQGTLATAYEAIGQFINSNSNDGARQEFLLAMQDIFGLQADQIAQIDFTEIAQEIRNASTTANMTALTAAENLVRSGETTTWEDQLVNNTTNQLLATNAVRDTLDNKLMRVLEKNELELEKQVQTLQATQTVDFAEKTMTFFKNIFDAIQTLVDPLGIFDGISAIIDEMTSDDIDRYAYSNTMVASQVGSTVTSAVDEFSADLRTQINGWGMAQQIAVDSLLFKSSEQAANTVAALGTADTYKELLKDYQNATEENTTIANEKSIAAIAQSVDVQQQQLLQQQELLAQADAQYTQMQAQQAAEEAARKQQEQNATNQAAFDSKRAAAAEQQRALQAAQQAMTTANHDNIEAIRESVSRLDELSNYLSPILDENRNQSGLLQTLSEKVDQLIQTVANKAMTTTVVSPTPNINTSYNERDRIYGPIKTW